MVPSNPAKRALLFEQGGVPFQPGSCTKDSPGRLLSCFDQLPIWQSRACIEWICMWVTGNCLWLTYLGCFAGQPMLSIPMKDDNLGATDEKEESRRIALLSEVQRGTPTLSNMAQATSTTASAGAPHAAESAAAEPAQAVESGADDKAEIEEPVEPTVAARKVAAEPTQAADLGAENRTETGMQLAPSAAANGSAPGSANGTPRPADLAPAPVWIDRLVLLIGFFRLLGPL